METESCTKCGGVLAKTGVMESGNSKFIKFNCKACGHEETKCEGVMG